MSDVIIKNNRYTVDPLYQWDVNQVLTIYGLSLASIPEIHFTNTGMDRAIVRQATMDKAGVISAYIPNSLLQKPYKITAYVCIYEGETFKSLYAIEIPVKPRTKPGDYTFEVDDEIYSFNAMENRINYLATLIEDHNQVDEELTKKYNELGEKYDKTDKDLSSKYTQLSQNVTDQLTGFSTDLGYLKNYVTPQMFGAKGDGVTDDTEAIKTVIANASKGDIIYFPHGKYLITKPIIVPSYLRLVGENKHNTVIVKRGNTVDESYNIDAVLILDMVTSLDPNSTRDYCEGQAIENLCITSENKSEYGIYLAGAGSHILLNELTVDKVGVGINFTGGSWVSELTNIDIGSVRIGFAFYNTGTSTNLKNVYVMTASEYGYFVQGLSYSHWENICADWCTDIVYRFDFCRLSIDGLGSECTDCRKTIVINNSSVKITSANIFPNPDNADYVCIEGNGSRLILENVKVSQVATSLGKLLNGGTDFKVEMINPDIETVFSKVSNLGENAKNALSVNLDGGAFSVDGYKSYLGAGIRTRDVSKILSGKYLLNGIYSDNLGTPRESLHGNAEWQFAKQCGDLFINNQPSKDGIALFQQIDSAESHTIQSAITAINGNVLTFNTLTLDARGEAYGQILKSGDPIKNQDGVETTISAVNYSANTITVNDASSYAVGDRISTTTKAYIRDVNYKKIQLLLAGTTSQRVKSPSTGLQYFDTTLGKPIWYNGTKWVDATGTAV